MTHMRQRRRFAREGLVQGLALACLLAMAGWALAGPSGLLAWSESRQLLTVRNAEIVRLAKERDEMRNRVSLLDPSHADPDLAGELLRRNLNVAHRDEMVMLLK